MPWLKIIPPLLWLAALLLLAGILSQLPLASIIDNFGQLNVLQWLGWLGLNLGIILIAGWRWQLICKLLNAPVSLLKLLLIRQAGQAISFITPGPQFGGEPLQVYWLYQRCQLAIHSALLALGLDRLFELVVNFSVLIIAVLLLMLSPSAEANNWQNILLVLSLLLSALAAIVWLLIKQPHRLLGWLKPLTSRWQQHPKLQHLDSHWQSLSRDLSTAVNQQKPALLQALLLSLLGWTGLLAELALLLSFFDLALDFWEFLLILVAMRLAFLLPLPVGIGSLEAALLWAFHFLNLPNEAVLGLIALMRLRDVLVLISGLICLRLLQKPNPKPVS